MCCKEPFDAVIIGAGIAGSAMAHALATTPRLKPWRIALIERSFSEPDRIVGELLQPGGVQALRELGMLSSLDGIEAMPVEGYNLIKGSQSVQVSFPEGEAGRCFHHGRFVMGLRRIALQNENVTAIQGNATRLIECPTTQRVLGVDVVLKVSADAFGTRQGKLAVYGGLVIVADGCFSNFRNTVLAKSACKPKTYSHTIASVLKDAVLPVPKYGTIVLPPGLGPVALYPLTERETRIWVDVQGTLPSDVRGYVVERLVPELPESLRECVKEAFATNRVRKMPNSFLPSMQQATSSTKKGVFLLGDSLNMRHPISGCGMTVSLKDVVYLRWAMNVPSLEDWGQVGPIIRRWHWARKYHVSTLNMLSAAMYGMLQRDDGTHGSIRAVAFSFFHSSKGRRDLDEFSCLVSGSKTSPTLLMKLAVSIGTYIAWLICPKPRQLVRPTGKSEYDEAQARSASLRPGNRLTLSTNGFFIGWKILSILIPIVWGEIRWW